MFGKFGDIAGLMKQAKEMQENLKGIREELAQTEIVRCSGGGQVEVTVKGDLTVKRIKINPDCVNPEDTEILEDLVAAAMNSALGDIRKNMQEKLSAATGGLNIPGLF